MVGREEETRWPEGTKEASCSVHRLPCSMPAPVHPLPRCAPSRPSLRADKGGIHKQEEDDRSHRRL
jgi:hypothetical protein